MMIREWLFFIGLAALCAAVGHSIVWAALWSVCWSFAHLDYSIDFGDEWPDFSGVPGDY